MNIDLLIGSYVGGGAERQFLSMANGLASKGHQVRLFALYPDRKQAALEQEVAPAELHKLYTKRPAFKLLRLWHIVRAPSRLRRYFKQDEPNVVYSALYVTNIIAYMACRRFRLPLVWGLRADHLTFNWMRFFAFAWCRRLSSRVPLMISNSQSGLDFHLREGFSVRESEVIHNGINTDAFQLTQVRNETLRESFHVDAGDMLIGIVARVAPVKNHQALLKAVAVLVEQGTPVQLICAGNDRRGYRAELEKQVDVLGLAQHVIWLDYYQNMPELYAALDVFCLPSLGEGFPNVVGEAMATGLPCVVSNVSDLPDIVSRYGEVVEANDKSAFASGLLKAYAASQDWVHRKSIRAHIESQYSVDRCINKTERALQMVAYGALE